MDIKIGAVYIAIGLKAELEAQESIKSLRRHNSLPITIITDCNRQDLTNKQASRWLKTGLTELIDYDYVLYLDADTRINGDISNGFKLLDKWDLAIAHSRNQNASVFQHIGKGEKLQTIKELCHIPLQLQAGVMFFNRQRCIKLFAAWRKEWERWQDQDQAALIRALVTEPVRVWLLSQDWNGGKLISHLFGRTR